MILKIDGLPELVMVRFSPQEADERLWEAYFRITESVFREFNPKARIPDRVAVKRLLTHQGDLYTVERAIVMIDGNTPAALFSMGFDTEVSPSYEENRPLSWIKIQVEKAFRRKRIATHILKSICRTAEQMGKKILQVETENTSARKYCEAFSGELVHQEEQHRMYLETANQTVAEEWLDMGRKKFPKTRFEFFRDCPEAEIDLFCRVYTEIINERPTGDMTQALITSPESRRTEEAQAQKRGIEWYTMISKEPDGDISGLTDIMYNPREPHKMVQYFTGISKRHRKKGLAKRLKAEMLQVIKEKFPEVEYITTTMAPDNRPMQAINAQLGFKSRKTCNVYRWKLSVLMENVEEKLRSPKKKQKRDFQMDSPG